MNNRIKRRIWSNGSIRLIAARYCDDVNFRRQKERKKSSSNFLRTFFVVVVVCWKIENGDLEDVIRKITFRRWIGGFIFVHEL